MASREYSTSATAYASSGGTGTVWDIGAGSVAVRRGVKHVVIRGGVSAFRNTFGPNGPTGKHWIARDASTGTMSTRRAACVLARVCASTSARASDTATSAASVRALPSLSASRDPSGRSSGGAEGEYIRRARTPARAFAASQPAERGGVRRPRTAEPGPLHAPPADAEVRERRAHQRRDRVRLPERGGGGPIRHRRVPRRGQRGDGGYTATTTLPIAGRDAESLQSRRAGGIEAAARG